MIRRTKIIATIGPASQSEEMLESMMRAGMNVARMNFSHGTHEEHAERIARLRLISSRLALPVAILQDLQGPKIRVGELAAPIHLEPGEAIHFYAVSRGMQLLLSGSAAWWNARHGNSGHVFQGRFRGHLVEDERYFWAVSRYAHLNPTPVLVEHPLLWKWSTYAGYVDPSRRLPWVAYDALLDAWQGEFGGLTPSESYRQYVESGVHRQIASPFDQAIDGWIFGSESFADRIRESHTPCPPSSFPQKGTAQAPLTQVAVSEAICRVLDVDPKVPRR